MMLNLLKEDFNRISKKKPTCFRIVGCAIMLAGFRAVLLYRIGFALRKNGYRICAALVERIMHHTCHCWVSTAAKIGPGFLIAHVGSIIIGAGTTLGANCDIRQNITLGGNYNRKDESGESYPTLGDNVSIGVGAVILGPVKIGANTIVGANSVVVRNMPAYSIVGGVPAKVIRPVWSDNEGRSL